MLYIVKWSKVEGPRAESKFASWDGKVTDATPIISWLIGRRVESAISLLQGRYGGRVILVEGSWNINKINQEILNDQRNV